MQIFGLISYWAEIFAKRGENRENRENFCPRKFLPLKYMLLRRIIRRRQKKKSNKQRNFWVRDIYKTREENGVYNQLVQEYQYNQHVYQYIHTQINDFNHEVKLFDYQ